MSDKTIPDSDIGRLAAVVASRIAASASTARLAGATISNPVTPTLTDRMASAVGQRLAGSNLHLLASAVAHRLVASASAAPLVNSVTSHFAEFGVERLASSVAFRLQPKSD